MTLRILVDNKKASNYSFPTNPMIQYSLYSQKNSWMKFEETNLKLTDNPIFEDILYLVNSSAKQQYFFVPAYLSY